MRFYQTQSCPTHKNTLRLIDIFGESIVDCGGRKYFTFRVTRDDFYDMILSPILKGLILDVVPWLFSERVKILPSSKRAMPDSDSDCMSKP